MKRLRPIAILIIGPVLSGLTVAGVSWLVFGNIGQVSEVAWFFVAGMALGVVALGPIAATLAVSERRPELVSRYYSGIGRCVTAGMGLSLGYLIACVRHGEFDPLSVVAWLIVFIGALAEWARTATRDRNQQDTIK